MILAYSLCSKVVARRQVFTTRRHTIRYPSFSPVLTHLIHKKICCCSDWLAEQKDNRQISQLTSLASLKLVTFTCPQLTISLSNKFLILRPKRFARDPHQLTNHRHLSRDTHRSSRASEGRVYVQWVQMKTKRWWRVKFFCSYELRPVHHWFVVSSVPIRSVLQ